MKALVIGSLLFLTACDIGKNKEIKQIEEDQRRLNMAMKMAEYERSSMVYVSVGKAFVVVSANSNPVCADKMGKFVNCYPK